MEILLPRMKYTHEIVGTHGGALLPERAPGAKALVCIGLKKNPHHYSKKSRGRRPRGCGQLLRVVGLGRDGTLHGT